jgi:hypothetical protein
MERFSLATVDCFGHIADCGQMEIPAVVDHALRNRLAVYLCEQDDNGIRLQNQICDFRDLRKIVKLNCG